MSNEATGLGASGVSRRRVVQGAAWAVPAVMVASAAPAVASSQPIYIDWSGATACKIPGDSWTNPNVCGGPLGFNSGYVLWATFVNNTGADVYVTISDYKVGDVSQIWYGIALMPNCSTIVADSGTPDLVTGHLCFLLPAGETDVALYSNANTDSANYVLTLTVTWGDSCSNQTEGPAALSGSTVGDPNPWVPGGGPGNCIPPAGCTCPPDLTPGDTVGNS